MSSSYPERVAVDDAGVNLGVCIDDPASTAEPAPLSESADRDDHDVGEADAIELHTVRTWRERRLWGRLVKSGTLPAVTILLAATAGYLQWRDSSALDSQLAATQSVRAATEGSIAMLSYRPETVEKDLTAAVDRLTDPLRDSYMRLINQAVIPSAKQKRISAVTTVPAAASVSVTRKHAVVLAFINQTTTVGNDPPNATASRVRVSLEKVHQRWLISQFEPI